MPVFSRPGHGTTWGGMTRAAFTGSRALAFGAPPAEGNMKRQSLRRFPEKGQVSFHVSGLFLGRADSANLRLTHPTVLDTLK